MIYFGDERTVTHRYIIKDISSTKSCCKANKMIPSAQREKVYHLQLWKF